MTGRQREIMYHIEKMGKRQLGARLEDELLNYILKVPVEVGQKIPNEFELAQRFGVGRSTVREAVKGLVTRGILEVRSGRPVKLHGVNHHDTSPTGGYTMTPEDADT